MRRHTFLVAAFAVALCVTGLERVRAADSFLQHMSPFRHMRTPATDGPASTHEQLQPATEGLNRRGIHPPLEPGERQRQWAGNNGGPLGERTEGNRAPTLEELRAHLLSRGIDPDRLDARFSRMQEARANGQPTGQAGAEVAVSEQQQLRTQAALQGDDQRASSGRVAEMNETRVNNGRWERPLPDNRGLNSAQVQTRLLRQGVTPEALNVRLGRMYGVQGADLTTADRTVGAGVGRVRSRR